MTLADKYHAEYQRLYLAALQRLHPGMASVVRSALQGESYLGDWGDIFSKIGDAAIQVGGQYAGAAVAAKMNEQAARTAAKQLEIQMASQAKIAKMQGNTTQVAAIKQQQAELYQAHFTLSDTPWYLWVALASASGYAIYHFFFKRGRR
ncbi:MAG: hypothetical protein ACRERV_13030 [Methylococcales bacterium]